MKRLWFIVILLLAIPFVIFGQKPTKQNLPQLVSFPTQDGAVVVGNLYGKGKRGVVLAHGGQFNKESWEQQAQTLVKAGLQVLAIDFRGYGQSKGPGDADPLSAPLQFDVLAAIRYLKKSGVNKVSVVGASMGGSAVLKAALTADTGEIDRLLVLAAWTNDSLEKLKGRKLFIVSRKDTRGDGVVRLTKIREQFDTAPEPKELVVVEGSAHAQHIFQTDQGDQLMREMVRFLTKS